MARAFERGGSECMSPILLILFIVADTYNQNFAGLQVAQETSAVRIPLHASFFLPPPASTLARPCRGPSRERSLPRLLSFPRADREKEGRACRRGTLSLSRECDPIQSHPVPTPIARLWRLLSV